MCEEDKFFVYQCVCVCGGGGGVREIIKLINKLTSQSMDHFERDS